jgi:hypothetical protein
MDIEVAIRVVGFSHLLQPPLTLLLASQLGLRRAFAGLSPLPHRIAQNMGVAAVSLPTLLGVFIGIHADSVVAQAPAWRLAFAVSVFWTWRLERQLRAIGPLLTAGARFWHVILTAIFAVQGPVFAGLLVWARALR